MEQTKPHQKIIDDLVIQIFKGALTPGEKLPPLEQLSERLATDQASARIGLKQLENMNLLHINHENDIYVKDFRLHAGIDFLLTVFACHSSRPDENIIDKQTVNQIWSFWIVFFPDIIRLAAENATMADLKALIDILDEELTYIHQPEKFIELEVMASEFIASITNNMMATLLYNATKQLNHTIIAIFVNTMEPETMNRYTEARKQMISLFMLDPSININSTIDNFRELMNNIWQSQYH